MGQAQSDDLDPNNQGSESMPGRPPTWPLSKQEGSMLDIYVHEIFMDEQKKKLGGGQEESQEITSESRAARKIAIRQPLQESSDAGDHEYGRRVSFGEGAPQAPGQQKPSNLSGSAPSLALQLQPWQRTSKKMLVKPLIKCPT
jgi:hypothetical protein